jgi:hypothetical protein
MYKANEFDYSIIDILARFQDSHPQVMLPRIEAQNWSFDRDISFNKMKFKNRVKRFFEKKFGFIPGEYRNYRVI